MKNKIKIFIALGITLITTLIFTISTLAQSGYEVNNNGNIVSLNLFDCNNTYVGLIKSQDGSLVYDNEGLSSDFIEVELDKSYINNLVKNWSSNYGIAFYNSNKNYLEGYNSYNNIYNSFTITNNNVKYVRFCWYNNSTSEYYTNKNTIMFNEGTTLLDYFPYGNYTNNKNIGNNGQIYEQLNGTTAKLFQTNITNINTAINTQGIIEETININNQTDYSWNYSSIPTIKNCIINYNPSIDLGNRATILLELKNATIFNDLTFTRIDKNEDRYIYLYNENKKLITTLTIARKVEIITHII